MGDIRKRGSDNGGVKNSVLSLGVSPAPEGGPLATVFPISMRRYVSTMEKGGVGKEGKRERRGSSRPPSRFTRRARRCRGDGHQGCMLLRKAGKVRAPA